MRDFNKIAETVHKEDDDFYRSRGVLIHSLEVSGYRSLCHARAIVSSLELCLFDCAVRAREVWARLPLQSRGQSSTVH